jgi:serine/threonine protein kinase
MMHMCVCHMLLSDVYVHHSLYSNPPFVDDTPMGIYQKILAGKLMFPRHFTEPAKDLIRKLLTADITKRIGNLKNGAADIRSHKWFADIDWPSLYNYQLKAPWVCIVLTPFPFPSLLSLSSRHVMSCHVIIGTRGEIG